MNLLINNGLRGELEAEIMEIIWRQPGSAVRVVLNQLEKRRPVAYTTVMTVMSRLYDKGILKREADDSGAYRYRPVQDKEHFLASASKKIIQYLLTEFGEVAVAQFMDLMENQDPKKAARWRRRLKRIK